MHITRLRVFDIYLLTLVVLCLILMFFSSSDPVIKIISDHELAESLEQFKTGNQIIFDLSVGILAGVFMYYLVVRIPECERRNRIRRNLERVYKTSKEGCIEVYLGCFMPSYPMELPKELCDMGKFKKSFKENHTEGQNRWYSVANNLGDEELKKLIIELELLIHEIQFTLSAVDVADEKVFSFLKDFSMVLYRSKNWSNDYDSIKLLLRFLWSFHTGWSWIDGYPTSDPVAEILAKI